MFSSYSYCGLFIVLWLQATVVKASSVNLDHEYISVNNFNEVRLSCFSDRFSPKTTLIENAMFYRTQFGEGLVLIGEPGTGVLDYTLSPETEGGLICRHNINIHSSPPIELAG